MAAGMGTTATTRLVKVQGLIYDTTYLVKQGDAVLGMITKRAGRRTALNPWKAYRGTGHEKVLLGTFWTAQGGKEGAINAVVEAK